MAKLSPVGLEHVPELLSQYWNVTPLEVVAVPIVYKKVWVTFVALGSLVDKMSERPVKLPAWTTGRVQIATVISNKTTLTLNRTPIRVRCLLTRPVLVYFQTSLLPLSDSRRAKTAMVLAPLRA